mgnify:CR=1 FL=1
MARSRKTRGERRDPPVALLARQVARHGVLPVGLERGQQRVGIDDHVDLVAAVTQGRLDQRLANLVGAGGDGAQQHHADDDEADEQVGLDARGRSPHEHLRPHLRTGAEVGCQKHADALWKAARTMRSEAGGLTWPRLSCTTRVTTIENHWLAGAAGSGGAGITLQSTAGMARARVLSSSRENVLATPYVQSHATMGPGAVDVLPLNVQLMVLPPLISVQVSGFRRACDAEIRGRRGGRRDRNHDRRRNFIVRRCDRARNRCRRPRA